MPRIVPTALNGMKLCRFKEHYQVIPVGSFDHNAQTADGYHDYCKECRKKIKRKWMEDNKAYVAWQNYERALNAYTKRPILFEVYVREQRVHLYVVRETANLLYGWYKTKHEVKRLKVKKREVIYV